MRRVFTNEQLSPPNSSHHVYRTALHKRTSELKLSEVIPACKARSVNLFLKSNGNW